MKSILLLILVSSCTEHISSLVNSGTPLNCLDTKFGKYCGGTCVEYSEEVRCSGCVISEHGTFCGDNCICYASGCRCGYPEVVYPVTVRPTSIDLPTSQHSDSPTVPDCMDTKFGRFCGGRCTEYRNGVVCSGCFISDFGSFCGDGCVCYASGCRCRNRERVVQATVRPFRNVYGEPTTLSTMNCSN
ncbi:uncharacterized protein LOC119075534 [Bradysia coprophila]|uniref:uncharacterized protein LOC119075534 n=1 Tax=Bradysia coprophila TaxID=38358 RepID=UPI00187DB730|nr:uncharacterized protein LOC119075534 [Bradysia coprophila]